MPAWLSSGTRQRTKCLWKGASEGDTRIDDIFDGSPLTIEIGSDSPIGITDTICNHTFRATGITVFRQNGGTVEEAQHIASHASPKTTMLYDRSRDQITLDEVERIII
jgi:integrase